MQSAAGALGTVRKARNAGYSLAFHGSVRPSPGSGGAGSELPSVTSMQVCLPGVDQALPFHPDKRSSATVAPASRRALPISESQVINRSMHTSATRPLQSWPCARVKLSTTTYCLVTFAK